MRSVAIYFLLLTVLYAHNFEKVLNTDKITPRSVIVLEGGAILVGAGINSSFPMMKSFDDGISWQGINSQNGLNTSEIWDFYVDNNGDIYASTFPRGLFVSKNFGTTWQSVFSGDSQTNNNLWAFSYRVSPTGKQFIFAGEGIFVSDDKGVSWKPSNDGIPLNDDLKPISVKDCIFTKDGIYIVAGGDYTNYDYNGVYYSDDDGKSWEKKSNGIPDGTPVNTILLNNDKILVSGKRYGNVPNCIFEKRIGETSWSIIKKGVSINTLKRFENKLFAGGGMNYGANLGTTTLFYSSDNGVNWNNILIDGFNITGIANNEEKSIYLATNSGLYRSSSPFTDISITNEIIKEYSLGQNYPNPFNPTTQLSYSLAKSGLVTLQVYNSLGEEISILVDKYQNNGKYTVEFNAGNLSSGVYYYRMSTNDFHQTNKMLLLR
ncbi:MAG: T9SS type A sorting domain-containing protein [Bacteroidetes bacterium]|nr:T9SS type A sorting domain-containing protein [Bacteroidota bacterium]MBU1114138.1 T9SS type A sorting domain-containing protein [Bacteroidota bacterium]MBU1796804.1 T9SS type A sorting domain-containing protein [Bacteroidota bacterium]